MPRSSAVRRWPASRRSASAPRTSSSGITEVTKNGEVLEALETGSAQVAAGTAWLWSREEMFEQRGRALRRRGGADVARQHAGRGPGGQVAGAPGRPAAARAAAAGEPPGGSGVSALEHILGEATPSRTTAASSCPRPGACTRRSPSSPRRSSTTAGWAHGRSSHGSSRTASRPSTAPGSGTCRSITSATGATLRRRSRWWRGSSRA